MSGLGSEVGAPQFRAYEARHHCFRDFKEAALGQDGTGRQGRGPESPNPGQAYEEFTKGAHRQGTIGEMCDAIPQPRQDFSRLCDDLIENVRALRTPDVIRPSPLTLQ